MGMPNYRLALAAGIACAASPLAAGAQTPASDSIPRYSRVTSVRELPDGRVLVSDAGLSRADLLSPELRFVRAAAQRGDGPLAFKSSDLLVAAGGDSTVIVDDIGAGLLVLNPSVEVVGRRAFPRLTSGARTLITEVRGGDAAGRLYFTGFRPNANPTAARDSAPLLRWTPATDAIDTLTWIRIPVPGMRRSEANPDSMINVRPDPFEWRDTWTVAPTGRVFVVRGDDFHGEWYDGATRVATGAAQNVPRVAVSADDIQRLRDQKFTINTPQGPRTISAATGAQISAVKPFVAEGAPPRVDQQGRVWVERSRASGSGLVTYDLFDNTGSAVLTVQLANGARTVGFGAGAVYVTKPVGNGRYEVTKGRWSGR